MAKCLGLDPVTLEGPCPLTLHDGRARLAVGLPEDDKGDVRLLCCRGGRWRSLGEVRAAIAYGHDEGRPYKEGGRSNIELAVWTRLLAHEAGVFQPADIPVPPAPPRASPAIERAREWFRLLIGLRWADGPRVPVAFSVRFVVAWTGLSHGAAHAALRALIESGVIREAGRKGRSPYYLPGPMPEEPIEPEPAAHDEQVLIARIIEEFDAEELPIDPPDGETKR